MRIMWGGKRLDVPTGFRIDENKWDKEKQRVKLGCTNKLKQTATEINADLLRRYTIAENLFKNYELKDVQPTVEQLKEGLGFKKYTPKLEEEVIVDPTPNKNISFWKAYGKFTRESAIQNNWTDSTKKKFVTLKNHLTACFGKGITFDTFDEEGINRYANYLSEKLDMRNTSVDKQLRFLRWVLRWCVRKGYTTNIVFETHRPKFKTALKKVVFLTREELERLETYNIPSSKQYLERVRDVFLFCCYSGLRYSDVANLKKSDVKGDHIEVTTVKTADSLIIELNIHSKAILDKYQNVPLQYNKALPVITNQRMNEFLKELAELAGIDEPIRDTFYKGNERIDKTFPKYALIGTHTARRTFICNALSLGIPPQVVMKWTGHSDYKAMKPYIDVADAIKAEEMKKFNSL